MTPPTPDAAAPTTVHRLPRNVEPHHYRLTFAPDLDKATFTGSAEIDFTVHEATDTLVLNAAELTIMDIAVHTPDGKQIDAGVTLDEETERATFQLAGVTLPVGPATLQCRFEGILNDRLRGFYRSTFVDNAGTTHTVATTQMESTDARRAFPCWDEPDRKAVFEITLVVEESMAAYSNGPVAEETPGAPADLTPSSLPSASMKTIRFAPTMKMSTYLVAMIVGPLEATKPRDVDGVPVRIVHAPGKANLTGFALDIAEHSLRFFTDYFAIPYPAEKLDLVAIPDFAFGAMENLGCVTFRETALLVDLDHSARTELERVADVVAHEIAHMWFGDLVTMGWWEGIWLNEAFATFMEILCVDAFRPDWQRWIGFGLEREAALAVDGLHATRPIEYPVVSPTEADGMFDVLTYQKGGSVLRMLEQYLGADTFRAGIRTYLTRHAYANTVTADLWQALEDASGEPVRTLMDTWILQGGHPIVTSDGQAFTQSPFSYSKAAKGQESAIGTTWSVPVLVRELSSTETTKFLLGAEPCAINGDAAGPRVVNAGGWGVYRVGYDTATLAVLAGSIDSLDALERFNLFADTWALVLADRTPLSGFASLASALGKIAADDPSAWTVVTGALGLCDRVAADEERAGVATAVRRLLSPVAESLSWEKVKGESERVPTLRSLVLATLGTIGGDESVREEAGRRFDSAQATPIDPDLEGAVLQSVAAAVRPGAYDAFLERYRHPANPQEELRYLTALASFPDEDLTIQTYELARTEVRTQNAPYLLIALLANRVAGRAVWERVERDWDELLARFPVNSHSRMLDGVRSLCTDATFAERVRDFLIAHPLKSGGRSVEQSLERLSVNVAFGTRERGRLGDALGPA